jgi:hypothetical protein
MTTVRDGVVTAVFDSAGESGGPEGISVVQAASSGSQTR